MTVAPLAFTTREAGTEGGRLPRIDDPSVENVHFGSIAVVSIDGSVLHRVGDPHWPTFTRSTLKPIQALPFIREGGHERFDWTSRQVALMCASHSGEAMHTETVASMLDSIDCDEHQLQCGCHVPGWYAALGEAAPPDGRWTPIQNNCSGKHAGFLAACRLHGETTGTYLDPSSALQRRVAAAVSELSGVAPHELAIGIDGCSAPNYAMPLSRLALLYARLAQGTQASHEGDSLGVLLGAMTQHPELVSGTSRSDLALMSIAPGDWVTKIGADGVQAIGIRSAGIGIAVKVADGNRDALYCTVVELLRQLGLVERETDEARFGTWYRRELHNARGLVTGRLVPAFTLRTV